MKNMYSYNEQVFQYITSEESAYWLGFLYADGCVHSGTRKFVSLSISNKDREHLSKYRDFMCPEKPIEEQVKQNAVRVTVGSKIIHESLVKAGCTPKKSLTLQAPPKGLIPEELVRHFVRGYFDGDGSIAPTKKIYTVMTLTGTEHILNYCRDQFILAGAGCRGKVRKDKNINAFRWKSESAPDLKIIYGYLYDGATIFLERKKEIFERVLT